MSGSRTGGLGSVSPAVEGGLVVQTVQSKHTVCRMSELVSVVRLVTDDWGRGLVTEQMPGPA